MPKVSFQSLYGVKSDGKSLIICSGFFHNFLFYYVMNENIFITLMIFNLEIEKKFLLFAFNLD
jgi:hypothetical protein